MYRQNSKVQLLPNLARTKKLAKENDNKMKNK